MKRIFLSFCLIALSFAVGFGQADVQANVRKTIEYLASDKLDGRRTGEPGATTAGNYLADEFKRLGLNAGWRDEKGKAGFLQPFPYAASQNAALVTGFNVIGVLPGHDPLLKNEAIVIGAHYDHLGRGGQGSLAPNSHDIHHGADDNASGTAAVLELARMFAREKSNKRTLIFVAFSGEEEGLFGSKFYVNDPVFPLERTVAMLNLDMVGRLYEDKLFVSGVGTAAEWRDLVSSKNDVQKVLDRSTFRPGQAPTTVTTTLSQNSNRFSLLLSDDGYGPSDQSSFYGKNIPVLFFFTGPHLDYHKPTDTADKINYEGEVKVINYVADILSSIAADPTRPTYRKAASTPIASGSRAAIKVTLGTMPSYTDGSDGMVIDAVRDDSPASRAGLKSGDKVVLLGGQKISNVQDYTKVLGDLEADKEYEIVVMRAGQRMPFKIIPAKRQ